jgi:hypothetical protein
VVQLRRLRQMFPDELVVIGVHSAKFPSEQLTENIRQAVLRHGIEHPVVNDAGFKIWNSYAVRAWPTLVLIDPTGRIAGETSGEILAEDFAHNIRAIIDQAPQAIDRHPIHLSTEIEREPERLLSYPARLLVADDRLFISDTGHNRILEVSLDENGLGGEVVRVFGCGMEGLKDGPAEQAAFHRPHGLGLRGQTLYVADTENHAIRGVDLDSGQVRTLAGTGEKAHGRQLQAGPRETSLRSPWSVLPLGEDYLFIAMAGSHQIWVMIGEDKIGPYAGSGHEALVDGPLGEAGFNQPSDLAFGIGYLFVADPEASALRAVSFSDDPQVVTLVGQGLFDWGDQDGPVDQSLLQHPAGLAFHDQQVYVADSYNHKIKLLDPLAGVVSTIVGTGQPGSQDGPCLAASLFEPEGVQVQGHLLYIADTNNHLVRVADLASGQLHSFRLRGFNRLHTSGHNDSAAELWDAVEVSPGPVQLVLDIHLPRGYKLNQDAPSTAQLLLEKGSPGSIQPVGNAGPITWSAELSHDQNLVLDLTLYYCEENDGRLCLIHDCKILVPIRVIAGSPDKVNLTYGVQLPG